MIRIFHLSSRTYFKDIFRIGFPIIIQGIVFQAQALINRAFLGNLKTEYLSAIGNTIMPYSASIDVVTAIATGLTIIISRHMGAQKYGEAQMHLNAALVFNCICSLLLFTAWFFLSNTIFSWMGVGSSLIQYCNSYIKIISLYLLVFGADMTVQASLQGIGVTRPIMFAGIYKVTLNIFLDWCLIFGNLHLPALGLNGAAIASATSNISSAVLLILYVCFSKRLPIKISLKQLYKPDFRRYKETMRLGLPTGFEIFAWNAGNLLLIRLLNGLEKNAVGMYTVIVGIEAIAFLLFSGMARGSLTLIGYKLGMDDRKSAMDIVNETVMYTLVEVSILTGVFVIFEKSILGIFTSDTPLINSSLLYFIIICAAMVPKSLNVVSGTSIRAFGDTKWMLCTQIFGSIFVIAFSYALVYALKFDIIAIYITLFLDETIRAFLNMFRLYKDRGFLLRPIPPKSTAA